MSHRDKLKPIIEGFNNGQERLRAYGEGDMNQWRSLPLRLSRMKMSRMASSISYYLVFAIFPFLIILLTLVTWFGDSLIRSVSTSIDLVDFFPEPVLDFVEILIHDVSSASTVGAISVSVISLIWAASKGINAIVISLRQIYHRGAPRRLFIVTRLFSVLLTLVVAIFIFAVMLVLAFSEAVMIRLTEWTGIVIANRSLIRFGSFATGFAILTLTFWLIFYFSAARKTKGRHAFAAAALSALAWVLTSAAFSLYASRSTSLSVYGSMTGVVILMLWLYVCTYALLLGAALHVLLRDRYDERQRQAVQPRKTENLD